MRQLNLVNQVWPKIPSERDEARPEVGILNTLIQHEEVWSWNFETLDPGNSTSKISGWGETGERLAYKSTMLRL